MCELIAFLCMFYPALSCWTQSKLPCGLSWATLVTPKVNSLNSSPLSEQGMAILCDVKERDKDNRSN